MSSSLPIFFIFVQRFAFLLSTTHPREEGMDGGGGFRLLFLFDFGFEVDFKIAINLHS